MCVIICIEDGKYPSKATLEDAESMNSHGGSIAWIDSKGRKYYQKGIKAKAITKIIKKQLKPKGITTAIIHFRIASVGNVNKKLCHPFEITNRVDLNLSGERMTTDLLFHNGTWSEYAEEMLEFLGKHNKPLKIPYGEFSDSRVMAYLAKRMGIKQMAKKVTGWNKIAVLTSEGIKRYGTGWVNFKGNTCSNDYFVPTQWSFSGSSFKDEFNYGYGNTLDSYGEGRTEGYLNDAEEEVADTLKNDFGVTDLEIDDWLAGGMSIYDIEAFLVNQESEMKQMLADEDEGNPQGLEEIDNIKEQRLAHQRRIDEECEISDNYQSMRRGAI
jgi:predicted glutamine amidotransferase